MGGAADAPGKHPPTGRLVPVPESRRSAVLPLSELAASHHRVLLARLRYDVDGALDGVLALRALSHQRVRRQQVAGLVAMGGRRCSAPDAAPRERHRLRLRILQLHVARQRAVVSGMGHVPAPCCLGAQLARGQRSGSRNVCPRRARRRADGRHALPHRISRAAVDRRVRHRRLARGAPAHRSRRCGVWRRCARCVVGRGAVDLGRRVFQPERVQPEHVLAQLMGRTPGVRLAVHGSALRQRPVPDREFAGRPGRRGLRVSLSDRRSCACAARNS